MESRRTKKLVFSALMATLTTVATMVIHIPALNGYIHLGDGLVLLSGILLGPMAGAAAGGIGSMMADLLSGYAFYAPATFFIKALAAFFGGYLYRRLSRNRHKAYFQILPFLSAGILCSSIVTGGYFILELIVYNRAAAMINIPFNLVQNLFSLIVSGALLPFLLKIHEIRSLNLETKSNGDLT
ncbi:ECF transporter S component [Clostridium sp. E02]|uniref:ECF transporter S component n=1 Tax=Clostridium sp. E02 TaxID=2487134 RepID=UPI000F53C7E1|nr:ECF transporter S component [Clostridium sp. E02]